MQNYLVSIPSKCSIPYMSSHIRSDAETEYIMEDLQ